MPVHMKKKSPTEIDINNFTTDDIYDPSEDFEMSDTKKKGSRTTSKTKNLDRRREIHVKCEHRRRKEIQDALDNLEAELPRAPKPRSKSGIIVDSAELIKDLTFSLDRLLNENQALSNRLQVNELTK